MDLERLLFGGKYKVGLSLGLEPPTWALTLLLSNPG